jgi:hypothetical protein
MISTQAMDGLRRIVIKATQSRLAMQANDICDVRCVTDQYKEAGAEHKVVVLTISSLLFRFILMFQVEDSETNRSYFLQNTENKSFDETFFEIANLCCGVINQDLLRHFPDLGMSTPYVLNGKCTSHIKELKPSHLSRYAITINDVVRLSAMVCINAYEPMHFVFNDDAVEETSGELELF